MCSVEAFGLDKQRFRVWFSAASAIEYTTPPLQHPASAAVSATSRYVLRSAR